MNEIIGIGLAIIGGIVWFKVLKMINNKRYANDK